MSAHIPYENKSWKVALMFFFIMQVVKTKKANVERVIFFVNQIIQFSACTQSGDTCYCTGYDRIT